MSSINVEKEREEAAVIFSKAIRWGEDKLCKWIVKVCNDSNEEIKLPNVVDMHLSKLAIFVASNKKMSEHFNSAMFLRTCGSKGGINGKGLPCKKIGKCKDHMTSSILESNTVLKSKKELESKKVLESKKGLESSVRCCARIRSGTQCTSSCANSSAEIGSPERMFCKSKGHLRMFYNGTVTLFE